MKNNMIEALKKLKILPEFKNNEEDKIETALVSVSDKDKLEKLTDYFLKRNTCYFKWWHL